MRYIEIAPDNMVVGEIYLATDCDQSAIDYVNNTPSIIVVPDDTMAMVGMEYDPLTRAFDWPKPDYISQKELLSFIQTGVNKV